MKKNLIPVTGTTELCREATRLRETGPVFAMVDSKGQRARTYRVLVPSKDGIDMTMDDLFGISVMPPVYLADLATAMRLEIENNGKPVEVTLHNGQTGVDE